MHGNRGFLSCVWLISLIFFGLILTTLLIRFAYPNKRDYLVGVVSQYPPDKRPYTVEVDDKTMYLSSTGNEILIFHWQMPAAIRCRYKWFDLEPDEFPNLRENGAFIDPCSGSRFSLNGSYLFGPAYRSLDRYQVRLEGGQIFVDLSGRIKGLDNLFFEGN